LEFLFSFLGIFINLFAAISSSFSILGIIEKVAGYYYNDSSGGAGASS
jgi:hypothetical protein